MRILSIREMSENPSFEYRDAEAELLNRFRAEFLALPKKHKLRLLETRINKETMGGRPFEMESGGRYVFLEDGSIRRVDKRLSKKGLKRLQQKRR